jgi:hypothetical protein
MDVPMTCGDVLTVGGLFGLASRYSCGGPEQLSQEFSYPFVTGAQANRLTQVTIEMRPGEMNHDIFILEGDTLEATSLVCDPGHCIAAGTRPGGDDEWVTFIAEPDRRYYVVVDGPAGTPSENPLVKFFCTAYCGPEECTNTLDDDCDGLIDCQDPDCSIDPACQALPPTGATP